MDEPVSDECFVYGAALEGCEVAVGCLVGFGQFGLDGGQLGAAVVVGCVVLVLGVGDGVVDEGVVVAVEAA
ncbi:MAG: hypothetical protein ACRDQU_15450 [Pseudonocardiaceae bacterium]